jgi:hypothetical protein
MILTEKQLIELTKRVQHSHQCKALDAFHIAYLRRPDGSVVVLESAVIAALGGADIRKASERAPKLNIRPGR